MFDKMTSSGHLQVMSKPATHRSDVRIAEFKAHLSECLRDVARGHTVTVRDRDRPIARVIPYSEAVAPMVTRGKGKLRDVPLPRSSARPSKVNSLRVLLEDRRSGR